MNKTDLVKNAAKAAYYVISSSIGFLLLGFLLNIAFLLVLKPELGRLAPEGGLPGSHAGGVGAILILILVMILYWKVILVFLVFGLLFPVFYFGFGKTHGIRKAISSVATSHKDFLTDYFVDRLWSALESNPAWMDQIQKHGFRILKDYLPKYLKKLDNMPFFVRVIFKHIVGKESFLAKVNKAFEPIGNHDLSSDEAKNATRQLMDELISQKFAMPSLNALSILFAIDILLFLALKIFV